MKLEKVAIKTKVWMVSLLFALAMSGYEMVALAQTKAGGMDGRTKQQLVELFTVMSRNMDFFKQGRLTNKAIIQFGILSNWDARPQLFRQVGDGNFYRLLARHVETSAARYFGRKVRHTNVANWTYGAEYYTGSPGDAGQGERIVVTKFAYNGKGLYRAYASFYSVEDGELLGKQKLTLKKVSSKGKTRFIVVEYLKA